MVTRLSWSLRWRLSTLWILEWGITGTILTYLPLYFTRAGLSPELQGQLMAMGALGLWVAPIFVAQVADRWLASEKYLGVSHFIGGLTLLALPMATELYHESHEAFPALMVLVGLYAVVYCPTVPVATSLSFRHLPDADAQFGKVRVWGTVGWMLSGLTLSLWLDQADVLQWLAGYPQPVCELANYLRDFLRWMPPPHSSDCFRIGALLSFALSSFCIFLPSTPPVRIRSSGIAPFQVLSMFRDRTFAVLLGITFLLSLAIPLYTLQVPRLLEQLGVRGAWVPAVMLVGQVSEFPALLLLPLFLKRVGLKKTFAIGIAAWALRYSFFAASAPLWLVMIGLALHGVCHVFLIIVIQLFVDARCPRDLRASAQNLFMFVTMGIGMPLGALVGGRFGQVCFNELTGKTDYTLLFSIPALLLCLLLLGYCRWFRVEEPAATVHAGSTPSKG